jgi:hypothetical protein
MEKPAFLLTLLLMLFTHAIKCTAQNNYILIDSPSSDFTVVDLKNQNISGGSNGYQASLSILIKIKSWTSPLKLVHM